MGAAERQEEERNNDSSGIDDCLRRGRRIVRRCWRAATAVICNSQRRCCAGFSTSDKAYARCFFIIRLQGGLHGGAWPLAATAALTNYYSSIHGGEE